PNDWMVHLLRIWDTVHWKYNDDNYFSREARTLCEAYADGLNFYAAKHVDEVVTHDLLPITGKDIVAGVLHKLPLFSRLDLVLQELVAGGGEFRRKEGEEEEEEEGESGKLQDALSKG